MCWQGPIKRPAAPPPTSDADDDDDDGDLQGHDEEAEEEHPWAEGEEGESESAGIDGDEEAPAEESKLPVLRVCVGHKGASCLFLFSHEGGAKAQRTQIISVSMGQAADSGMTPTQCTIKLKASMQLWIGDFEYTTPTEDDLKRYRQKAQELRKRMLKL